MIACVSLWRYRISGSTVFNLETWYNEVFLIQVTERYLNEGKISIQQLPDLKWLIQSHSPPHSHQSTLCSVSCLTSLCGSEGLTPSLLCHLSIHKSPICQTKSSKARGVINHRLSIGWRGHFSCLLPGSFLQQAYAQPQTTAAVNRSPSAAQAYARQQAQNKLYHHLLMLVMHSDFFLMLPWTIV